MRKLPLLALALLAASPLWAGGRTRGRSVSARRVSRPPVAAQVAPPSAEPADTVSAFTPAPNPTPQARPSVGAGFSRSTNAPAPPGSRSFHRSLRRADGDAPVEGTSPVSGAFIRSEGLGALREQPSSPQRTHAVEAGDRIQYEDGKGTALTNHKGVFQGAKDTPPKPSPGWGTSSSGYTGITETRPSGSGN